MSDDKNHFAVRLNSTLRETLHDFKIWYEENNDTILKTDKQIFEALLDTALSKFQPFKDQKEVIEKLQKENQDLKTQLEQIASTKEETTSVLRKIKAEKQELENQLTNVLQEKKETIIKKSDINIVSRKLIERYLKDKETKRLFEKLNNEGRYDGYFDRLDADNETENIKRLLLNTFLLSAVGKRLPTVVPNSKIKQVIDNYTQNIGL